jgi:hypothetical protein
VRGPVRYDPDLAQNRAELWARRPKTAKLAADDRLQDMVQDRLIYQAPPSRWPSRSPPAIRPIRQLAGHDYGNSSMVAEPAHSRSTASSCEPYLSRIAGWRCPTRF